MSRKVCCEVSSNISLSNLVSKDVCSLLGYSYDLHPSERILRNIISVLRMSVNETWIGLLYFLNHSYWNWNKIQTTFLGHKKYKQSLLQKQDTNKVCCKNKIQTKFVAKYKIQAKFVAKTKFVANPKYRNSGCKTGLGGASYNVHRKMRRYLGEASSPSLFKMSQVLKNKIGWGDVYGKL